MTLQELIDSAKVQISKNESNSFYTIEVDFPNRSSKWEWAPESAIKPDRVEYHVKNSAIDAYREFHKNCSENPCESCYNRIFENISSQKFVYARFVPSSLGNYYNLYHKDDTSPTGVSMTGGCSEKMWEEISKLTGNQSNYYNTNECKMSAR